MTGVLIAGSFQNVKVKVGELRKCYVGISTDVPLSHSCTAILSGGVLIGCINAGPFIR